MGGIADQSARHAGELESIGAGRTAAGDTEYIFRAACRDLRIGVVFTRLQNHVAVDLQHHIAVFQVGSAVIHRQRLAHVSAAADDARSRQRQRPVTRISQAADGYVAAVQNSQMIDGNISGRLQCHGAGVNRPTTVSGSAPVLRDAAVDVADAAHHAAQGNMTAG